MTSEGFWSLSLTEAMPVPWIISVSMGIHSTQLLIKVQITACYLCLKYFVGCSAAWVPRIDSEALDDQPFRPDFTLPGPRSEAPVGEGESHPQTL